MYIPRRIGLIPLLFLLFLLPLSGAALAADDDEAWAPTPPRLSFIDGEVSYWREGAEDWARARPNLALAVGDALYTGNHANFEVQFGSRSFARADENSQLSLVALEERFIQFKVTSGRVSFDLRSMVEGDTLEVSTPNAVFVIEHPGYYRVEVDSRDTHFITRRGGEATVITADGRSLGIYPSEDIVITAGDPVRVATYAAPEPDAWDRWNDARSDRVGESVSTRYLPPGGLWRGRARLLRPLAGGADLRRGLDSLWRERRLGALQHRLLGLGSLLRLDLDRRCAVGLGALPLRPLGPYRRLLGVGAGAGGAAAGVFARAGGVHDPRS
jgi:hypothetical protein